MRGSKLVSDYLTDRKKSLREKRRQLVVTDSKGAIVWLVGERVAAPFAISKGTAHIIKLTWRPT
jgi:tRNA(Ile)-lysidine synthase